jgi:tetratricopeptide (TPR) repeat protein
MCTRYRLGDSAGICTSYGRIGAAQEKMGNHSAALESLTLQLSLAEEIESLNEQISAVGNLGVTCRSLERYDQAATYFQEQLRLSKEGKDIAGQINAYGNMSVLFRKMGRHDEAMDMLSKQLEVADDALPSNPSTPLREGPQSTCAAPHTQPGAIALPNDVMSTEQPHVVATRTPRMDGDKTCVKKELSTTVEGSNSTGAALSTQPGDIALPNDERSKEQPRVVASRKLRMDGKETSAEVEFGHRCTTVEEQNLAEKVKVPKLCRSAPPFHVPKDPVQTSEKLDPNGGDQRAKAMEHAKSVLQALSMMAREGEEPRPADSRKLTDADVSTAAEMTGDRKPAPAKSKSALVDRTNSASRRQELDGASIGGDSKASGKRRDGDAAAGPERLHGGTMAVCTEEAAPKAAPEMQSVVTQDPAACLQEQELKDTARRAAQRLARKLDDLCKQKDWNGALALEKRVLKCVHDTEGMSPRLAVFMYGRLAIAYEQQGSCPEAAIGLHGKIIQLARSLGDSNLEAATLECKADGCISLDDYEGASAALTRLVELLDKLGDDQALLDSYAKLFDVYGKLGHRIKMLDTIRKLLSRTERAGDLLAQGAALTKMAQALSVMGNFEEARRTRATARSVQTKAVQHYSTQLSSGDSRVQAAACVKLATVYKDLGRHTEAIDMRAKAKILAARLGALPMERVRTHPGTMPFDFDPQDNSIEESEQESSSMSDDDEFPAPSPPTLPRLTPAALSRKGSQDPVQHGAAGSEQSTPSPFATGNLSPECPPEDQEAPNTNKRSENPPLVAGPTPESSPVARTPQDKVRRIAGPTPESSPGPHAPQDQVIAAHILKANDMCEDTMDDMSKMESAVLELLRLCQNEEWKTAASMHGRMVPVAAKLAESEPRMASSIYGNLGFALESLAEEVENPADGLTLWMEAITMHQRARSIACRSVPYALLSFA